MIVNNIYTYIYNYYNYTYYNLLFYINTLKHKNSLLK